MTAPTHAELHQAGKTLVAIARIESLRGGVVTFDAEGLAGGWWYEPDDDRPGDLALVWAPVPDLPASDLDSECARLIEQGIEWRQHQLDALALAAADAGDQATVRDLARLMYD